ncbi:MAG: PmoA family protein [Caldilineaceae bacterium]|nr:PmoA family protein [Caldilineaceae bacterium]
MDLPNNGSQRHDGRDSIEVADERFAAREKLSWITQAGGDWLDETRAIGRSTSRRACATSGARRCTSARRRRRAVRWQATADFSGAGRAPSTTVRSSPRRVTKARRRLGQAAPWLAYTGCHDGSGNTSTLAFLDHPANLRYPNRWFIRQTPYAYASFAFMFNEVYAFEAGETLTLRYRLVVANGGWDGARVEGAAVAWRGRR